MISLILAAIIPISHIWETNSTPTVRRFYTYSANSYKMIPMPNYVTNGITHWWDGEINLKIGYHKEGHLSTWKDLVGNRDLSITSDSLAFTGKGLSMFYQKNQDSIQYIERTKGIACCDKIPDDEIVTVEVCAVSDVRQNIKVNGTFMTLACNGNDDWSGNYYYPMSVFMAFVVDSGSYSAWYGNSYRLVAARGETLSIRCQSFSSDYDFIPSYSAYMMFTYSMSNPDKSKTSEDTASGYYQPYWDTYMMLSEYYVSNSSFPSPSFARTVFKISESATRNNVEGEFRNATSVLHKIDVSPDSFTIGGVRYDRSLPTAEYQEGQFFNGRIFCIRIYNRVLTEEERKANAQIDFNRFYYSCAPDN